MYRFIPLLVAALSVWQVVLPVQPALAAVTSLTAALIPANQAPPGFGAPHYRVYSHFVKTMTLGAKSGGSSSSSSCRVDSHYRADGFTSGIIQEFGTTAVFASFGLCGYLFHSTAGATRAWQATEASAASFVSGPVKLRVQHIAPIGDASLVLRAHRTGLAVSEIAFRHANAIVLVVYLGPASYSLAREVNVARGIDQQLP